MHGTPPYISFAIAAIEVKGIAGAASIGGTAGMRLLSAVASPSLQWAAHTGAGGGISPSQLSMAARPV